MLRASAEKISLRSLFTNLSENGSAWPQSYLLEIDSVKILLDCGWDQQFTTSYIEALLGVISSVDAVLISSSEHRYCGALPVIIKFLKPNVQVFAPQALAKIAVNNVLARFMSHYPNEANFLLNNGTEIKMQIDDIFTAFRSVKEPQGKNTRITNIALGGEEMTVVRAEAISSGILGSYCWRLQHQNDDLLYCQEYSLHKSRLVKQFVVPAATGTVLLCCGGHERSIVQTRNREDQGAQLLREITNTLRWNSNVLIPSTVAGVGIEMAVTIDRDLREKGIQNFKVVLVSLQIVELIERIKTMTDVLRDNVIFEETDFFENLVLCKNADAVKSIPSPKVVIADGSSLDCGPAAELLAHFILEKNSLIVCNTREHSASTTAQLAQRKRDGQLSQPFETTFKARALLSKAELNDYYDQLDAAATAAMASPHHGAAESVSTPLPYDEPTLLGIDSDDDDEKVALTTTVNRRAGPTPKLPSFLMFPAPVEMLTLSRAIFKGDDLDGYGVALSDEQLEQLRLAAAPQRREAERNLDLSVKYDGDVAYIGGSRLVNDAQREANALAKITTRTVAAPSVQANVFLLDVDAYIGKSDAVTTEHLIKSQLAGMKRFVGLQCTPAVTRSLAQSFDKDRRRGAQVPFAELSDVTELQLTASIQSFSAELEASLFRASERHLRSVREARSGGVWQVGAFLAQVPINLEDESAMKRRRTEPSVPRLAVPSRKPQTDGVTELTDGSVFLGAVDISAVTDASNLESDVTGGMTSLGGGRVCIRKESTGNVTLSCIVGSEAFDMRNRLYENFQQSL